MKKQVWFCDECRKQGVIEYDIRAGVFEVIHLIGDYHKTMSPECSCGVRDLRVVNAFFEKAAS